jgi:hypothetical protein
VSALGQKQTFCGANVMSALGQKRTYALQQGMSALPPIATAKAKFRTRSCLLYPQKRTCAAQLGMSAKGQKRTWPSKLSVQHTCNTRDFFLPHASGGVSGRVWLLRWGSSARTLLQVQAPLPLV